VAAYSKAVIRHRTTDVMRYALSLQVTTFIMAK